MSEDPKKAVRFDASLNRVVEPGEDEYDEWWDEPTIWYLTDSLSNGRWLYVDRPSGDGDIKVGIHRVYRKFLSPEAARGLAAALIAAADESDAAKPEREAAKAQRAREFVYTTSGVVAVLTVHKVGSQ